MESELLIESGERPVYDRTANDQRYRTSDKGAQRNGRYNKRRHEQYSVEYNAREFVAWDGEGINETDGSHTYVLLANSVGGYDVKREGLATVDVLNMFLSHASDKRIHVGYGLSYDVNMWLKDLDKESLTRLYSEGSTWWKRYRLEWRGGKSFTVFQNGKRFQIQDVLPFFQRSFVAACDEYLGTDWPDRERVIREKANRGHFTFDDIAGIREYNDSELVTLVLLCQELRSRLDKVHIRVNRWDGPGAIATALYKRYGVKESMCSSPESVAHAATYGYAGGRFEIVRKGHSTTGAYQYDIRSAYPAAMRNLPCLAHGTWHHAVRPTSIVPFGIYRVELSGPQVSSTRPQPLWVRNHDGTVYFSDNAHGWYWSPEAQLGLEAGATIHEGWEYETQCECDPFGFVEPLYNKRAALKKAGDGAHVGLKLGLNSLYGKLAQQVGWEIGPPLRLPPFHCIEWAGYVTSHCRSQVYRAAQHAPDDVIAFETDAIFSRVPLPLKLGDHLGDWEATEYASLTYLKSGMYWGTLEDGTEIEKSRGINKGSIPRALAIAELQGEQHKLPAEQTRFITLGQALSQNFALWTHWITSPRMISVALWGKRIDVYDGRDNYARTDDGWEETIGGPTETEFSYPYEIEWKSGEDRMRNPDGFTLEEAREIQAGYDLDMIR
jgi:hypothetical protein